ncbi:MAG: acyl-CoA dehydrogenase family protein [Thermodesulfobacteriota bacterium]|nr:acyl-CoA dehydrogenase family protein [Thermodesulfobacteriota bacterium]
MDFNFTDEQEALRRSVYDFVEKECPREFVRKIDENKEYPYEVYDKMVKLGWFGLPYPEEYGGSNCGAVEFLIVTEGLARYAYDMAAVWGIPVLIGLNVLRHGSAKQKDLYIPRIINGQVRFSISITEPNAGSDAAAVSTEAVQDGNYYILNGQKVFSTGAQLRDNIIHIVARTDKTVKKHKGLTIFMIDHQAKGLEIRRLNTLGRHILGTNEIFLEDVRVPQDSILGELNRGWDVLLSQLELERLFACGLYIGNGTQAVADAVQYAKEREQFGQPIGNFQSIAHMLADMSTEVEAARLLTYHAATMIDEGTPCIKEVSMAKLFGSETLARVTNKGMQILGGYGFMMEYDMQRYFRDARVATVTAGTSQIQRTIIARQLGLNV